MGFFSWKCSDSGNSIYNKWCSEPHQRFTVYMKDNYGKVWVEKDYKGYGEFGGKDFYELLAEMNGRSGRDMGINIWFGSKEFVSPKLFQYENSEWGDYEKPQDHDGQGNYTGDECSDSECSDSEFSY